MCNKTEIWVRTKNVGMCLNIEFVLCQSATNNNQLDLLTSESHCLNDMSRSILQPPNKKPTTLAELCSTIINLCCVE